MTGFPWQLDLTSNGLQVAFRNISHPYPNASRGMGGINARRPDAGVEDSRGRQTNDPVPKERRHMRMAPGMPPIRRLRHHKLHGTRAERDLRVRGRYGSAGVWGQEPWCKASRST